MMASQKQFTRRKYSSLLLSLLFHAFSIALLFYWATILKQHSPYSPSRSFTKSPAKVSFHQLPGSSLALPTAGASAAVPSQGVRPVSGSLIPRASVKKAPSKVGQPKIVQSKTVQSKSGQNKVKQAKVTNQDSTLHSLAKTDIAAQPSQEVLQHTAQRSLPEPQKKVVAENLQVSSKPPGASQPKEIPVRSSTLAPLEQSPSKAADSLGHDNQAQEEPLSGPPSSFQGQSSFSTSSGGSSQETSRRAAITGAALVNAFKGSFYTEQEERPDGGDFQGGSQGNSSGSSSDYASVTERLKEWNYSSYQRKIQEALIRATRLHKKYISVPTSVAERLTFKLIINEEGQVRAEPLQPPTGLNEVDTYITQFFSLVDIPPIPKRFGLKEFQVHVTIQLLLSQGGHFLQLRPITE